MLIDSYIDDVLRDYSPADREFETAVNRAERVGRVLQNDREFGVLAFEVGGSCAKGTALAPIGDVDLFVYLDPGQWQTSSGDQKKPATVLGEFERRLRRTYRLHIDNGDVGVRAQEHSIRVRYMSEGSAAIDVVPALWDGNRAYQVLIPERGSKEWKLTSVRRQRLLLDKLDTRPRHLRRGIRLLKLWRNLHRLEIRSYALEILGVYANSRIEKKHPRGVFIEALQRIADTSLSEPTFVTDYVRASEYRPAGRVAAVIYDPAVPDNNVADNLTASERNEVVSAAKWSRRNLMKAEAALANEQVREGKKLLREALGLR